MIDTKQVKSNMSVYDSENGQCAIVDKLEGKSSIKLQKDESGQAHFIPVSWVKSIADNKLHLDRPSAKMTAEWKTSV